jgi:hypothetical protein
MRIRGFLVVAGCLLAVSLFAQPKYSDWAPPVNLGSVVNSSPYQDFSPAVSKDELRLYFASNRPGSHGMDLWVSERASKEDPWGPPANLGSVVNSDANDSAPALSRDEHWLFFTSSRPGAVSAFQNIWASYRENVHDNFGWGLPTALSINSTGVNAFPSYFANDEGGAPFLYFACSVPGSSTGLDIYMSELQPGGDFGPRILVPELSSGIADGGPSIRFDGLEIFFFRNPKQSALTADLWVATRNSVTEPWSAPVNLGPVVNSAYQDSHPYIAPDRESLYFCSDRDHPGDLDLYVTTRTKAHP